MTCHIPSYGHSLKGIFGLFATKPSAIPPLRLIQKAVRTGLFYMEGPNQPFVRIFRCFNFNFTKHKGKRKEIQNCCM